MLQAAHGSCQAQQSLTHLAGMHILQELLHGCGCLPSPRIASSKCNLRASLATRALRHGKPPLHRPPLSSVRGQTHLVQVSLPHFHDNMRLHNRADSSALTCCFRSSGKPVCAGLLQLPPVLAHALPMQQGIFLHKSSRSPCVTRLCSKLPRQLLQGASLLSQSVCNRPGRINRRCPMHMAVPGEMQQRTLHASSIGRYPVQRQRLPSNPCISNSGVGACPRARHFSNAACVATTKPGVQYPH